MHNWVYCAFRASQGFAVRLDFQNTTTTDLAKKRDLM
jgi:hypothetical protein